MFSFKAGLRNELLLMLYRKKTIIFFVFCALAPLLLAAPLGQLQNTLGVAFIGASFPLGMLGLYTMFLIPLFIFFTAADLFPGELASRTLKLALVRPITRIKLFAAKTAALGVSLLALLLILGVFTFLGGAIFGSGAAQAAGDTLIAYLAAFVPMLALGAAAIFLAQFFKSAASSLIVAILVYAALRLLPVFVHSASFFAVTSFTDWHTLWLAGSLSASKILTTFLFLAANFVLFFSLGFVMFERKEV